MAGTPVLCQAHSPGDSLSVLMTWQLASSGCVIPEASGSGNELALETTYCHFCRSVLPSELRSQGMEPGGSSGRTIHLATADVVTYAAEALNWRWAGPCFEVIALSHCLLGALGPQMPPPLQLCLLADTCGSPWAPDFIVTTMRGFENQIQVIKSHMNMRASSCNDASVCTVPA